jgi:ATP synthase protein I
MTLDDRERLRHRVELQARRMRKAEHDRGSLLQQTVFLGTLGLIFVLPVLAGAYAGDWLDHRSEGYSSFWTPTLIGLGLAIGVINVYLFVRKQV